MQSQRRLLIRICESGSLLSVYVSRLRSVIKSRMQAGQASALKYKSSFDGLLSVLREEGVAGLYKGVASKLVQSVLTAAILFASQRRYVFRIRL